MHQLGLLLSWDVECSLAWRGSRGFGHRACPTVAPALRPQVLPSAATAQGKPAWALHHHHPPLPPAPDSSLRCPQRRATGTTTLSAPSPLTTANVIVPSSPAGADPQPPTAPLSPRAPPPDNSHVCGQGVQHKPRPAPHRHAQDMSSPRGPVCVPIHVPTSVASQCPLCPARLYATVRSRRSSLVRPCICPFHASGSQTSLQDTERGEMPPAPGLGPWEGPGRAGASPGSKQRVLTRPSAWS